LEILVPHDGSSLADAALPYAEAIAGATGAALRLFGVAERESGGLETWPDDVRSYVEQTRLDALGQTLANIADDVHGRGQPAERTVVLGDPADEILAAADDVKVAMVVMATQGRGGIDRLLLGSVAGSVVTTSAWRSSVTPRSA
jgi:nucleotide-binding universal stress UspA family protein